MPGSATHIAIAERIYSILGKNVIQSLPLFFSGNIAPDAIHAKQGYVREDKRRTHLTEGMPTDSFHNTEKQKLFHDRVNDFIKNYYLPSDEQKDLYLGYVIHLLADELFNITKRTPFNRLIFTDGIDQNEKEIFIDILADIDNSDKLVICNYVYTQDVSDVLGMVWDYEIKDYIGKKELNDSKRYVISKFQKKQPPQKELKYYSYDEAIEFVEYAVNNIIERLSGKSSIVKIL